MSKNFLNAALKAAAMGVFVMGLALSSAAQATPSFDDFGPLPNFDPGSGIPFDPFAISTATSSGGADITIGLSATRRFSNPALGNDGAGTFFAGAGANFGDPAIPGGPGPSASLGSAWNFNFFVGIDGATSSDFVIILSYDFDPAVGNIDLGTINLSAAVPGATEIEDSQNLLFGFLASDIPGVLSAPGFAPFDPNAPGTYEFSLSIAEIGANDPLATVAIDVVVEASEPGMLALFGVGLAGLSFMRRRRRIA